MKRNTNTDKIVKKAAKRLSLFKVLKSYGASTSDMKDFYVAVIRPTFEYGAQVWNGGITKDQSKEIERIQKRALKIIYMEDDYDQCLQTTKLTSLKERRDQLCIQLIKCQTLTTNCIDYCPTRNRETRQNSHLYYNFTWRTERFRNSPISYAISKYNETSFEQI